MKQPGLMKHVRAHLALNPALTTDELMKFIAPSFPGYSPVWLRHEVNRRRRTVSKEKKRPCRHCKGTGVEQ